MPLSLDLTLQYVYVCFDTLMRVEAACGSSESSYEDVL
jgi:hypothetical protein